jgi:hypothetical protein
MKDDLDEDIPGSRMSIEDVATRFNITFLFVMSMIGAILFLIGIYETGPDHLKAVPEPLLFLCLGMGAFSLFFPWFTAFYFARHFLHTVRDLEGRLERMEKDQKPRKVETPWREGDDIV